LGQNKIRKTSNDTIRIPKVSTNMDTKVPWFSNPFFYSDNRCPDLLSSNFQSLAKLVNKIKLNHRPKMI
jgi:hypothetical protein